MPWLNDSGDIVGFGEYKGGTYGFLLTPNGPNSWALASVSATSSSDPAVPELSTWVLMAVGFAGLGSLARLRRRSLTLCIGRRPALRGQSAA